MMDLDAKLGFVRWRVAGLSLNLIANGAALYGAVRLLRDGSGAALLAVGLGVSLLCIGLLARPDLRPEGTGGDGRVEPGETSSGETGVRPAGRGG